MSSHASQCGCRCSRSGCGCTSANSARPVANPTGLDQIGFRLGTHGSFLEDLTRQLSGRQHRELWPLRTRDPSDPTIALLDVWASIADVLTFYQERIANEGYLRTATERRSLEELGALVGYRPRPGVAASTYVAITVDETLPDGVEIAAGTRLQSVPANAQQIPEVFETSDPLFGKPQWNRLRPAMLESQLEDDDRERGVVWISGREPVRVGDRLVIGPSTALRAEVVASVRYHDEHELTELVLARGNVIVEDKPDDETPGDEEVSLARADSLLSFARTPPSRQPTRLTLGRRRTPEHVLGGDGGPAAAVIEVLKRDSALAARSVTRAMSAAVYGNDRALEVSTTTVTAAPFGRSAPPVHEFDVATDRWRSYDAVRPVRVAISNADGEFAVGGAIGASSVAVPVIGPREMTLSSDLPVPVVVGTGAGEPIDAYGHTVTLGRPDLVTGGADMSTLRIRIDDSEIEITETGIIEAGGEVSVGDLTVVAYDDDTGVLTFALAPEPFSLRSMPLDAQYDEIVAGQPVIVENALAGDRRVLRVLDAAPVVVQLFGMTGSVTLVTFDGPWIDTPDDFWQIRGITIRAVPRPLPVGGRPITEPVSHDRIVLDGLYDDLEPGHQLIVEGTRLLQSDDGEPLDSGIVAAERALVSHVTTRTAVDGRTSTEVGLADDLAYAFVRDTVRIHGNVAAATHGDSHHDLLGDGDASRSFQRFELFSEPLTHLPSAEGTGAESSLEVSVNGLRWYEVDDLVDSGPTDRHYVTETVDGEVSITMGDGVNGARLPTGQANVAARYRSGIGTGGNLEPGQLSLLADHPRGTREVVNPVPATGGVDPDRPEWMRERIPLTMRALDRLVSVSDINDFALLYSGVGKARTDEIGDALVVTIAPAADVELAEDSELLRGLERSIVERGDPAATVEIVRFERKLVFCSFDVEIDADRYWENVEPEIRSALIEAFGFEERSLGAPIGRDELTAVVAGVAGVESALLGVFGGVPSGSSFSEATAAVAALVHPVDGDDSAPGEHRPRSVMAATGRTDDDTVRGAELLYVHHAVTDSVLLNLVQATEGCR